MKNAICRYSYEYRISLCHQFAVSSTLHPQIRLSRLSHIKSILRKATRMWIFARSFLQVGNLSLTVAMITSRYWTQSNGLRFCKEIDPGFELHSIDSGFKFDSSPQIALRLEALLWLLGCESSQSPLDLHTETKGLDNLVRDFVLDCVDYVQSTKTTVKL